MNRLNVRLPVLRKVLVPSAGRGPVPMAAISDVVALIDAIARKAKFADMHMALLPGIDWERYHDLGRCPAGMDGTGAPPFFVSRIGTAASRNLHLGGTPWEGHDRLINPWREGL